MCRWPADGRLDGMSIYEITPTATTFLAQEYERWGHHGFSPWFLVARLVFLALVITAVWLIVRAYRGHHGIRTLRDAYAKGEVNEAEYRERLAVLKETRRR
jgi:putative membrane protein